MADRIGQQLGNYRLTRLLGRGGFADVYLGEHVDLLTMVAIKVLHTRVAEEDVAHFRQEARLLASLKHPHIVRVFDFGVDEGTPYLVMDYAPNGTLLTRHPRGTHISDSTVVGYVKQIAQALQYAHDRKVIHRDIKPENMLIGENDELLLSDFGIALIAQSSHAQSTQDVIGTVAYMSPEQIQGKPRAASDQYSLGIVVYEWLGGTCPFRGSFTEMCTQHMFAPLPSLHEKVPTISPSVEHVVTIALAKDPKQRFASVSAFATALEQASQDALPTKQLHSLSVSSPLYIPSPPSDVIIPPPTVATVVASLPGQLEPSVTVTTQPNQSASASVLTTQASLNLPTSAKITSQPRVSRRAVLIATASVVAVAAIGTGVFVITRQQPSPDHVVVPPTRTVKPQESPVNTPVPTQSQPFAYQGHTDEVWRVTWSPDGKRIASSSKDKTVQVWNASDGGNVFTYTGHTDKVAAVAWSRDGKRIASGSDDKTVQVWNASDGNPVFTYRGHSSSVLSVVWSPDGNRIASSSSDGTVQVWNVSDGSKVFTYTGSDWVWSLAWSPDGSQIAFGSDYKTVQVWNASNWSKIFAYGRHSDWVWSVAWSPDSKRIASSSWDKTVQLWDASDGNNVFTYTGHSDQVWSVAWSPDGKRIASGSLDKTVQVWNANDGSNVFTYTGHSNLVDTVAWSPDGKRIASGSWDKKVQVWNAT